MPAPAYVPRSRVDLDALLALLEEETLCASKVRACLHLTLLAICERGVASPFNERPLDFAYVEGVLALADAMIDTSAVLDRTAAVQNATRLLLPAHEVAFDGLIQRNFDKKLEELTGQCERLAEAVRTLRACPPQGVPLS
jgi:hypothetical protein